MSTKGEYRVGIAFNPSNMGIVDQIKKAAADFIDQIDCIPDGPTQSNSAWDEGDYNWATERDRLKNRAMDLVEEAAMWAVKAATKPKP